MENTEFINPLEEMFKRIDRYEECIENPKIRITEQEILDFFTSEVDSLIKEIDNSEKDSIDRWVLGYERLILTKIYKKLIGIELQEDWKPKRKGIHNYGNKKN
jgi:hypothetical protein